MTTNNPEFITQRRANACVTNVAIQAALFSCFATVPISIRQRDWRVLVFPFIASFVFAFTGEMMADTKGQKWIYKSLGWGAAGTVAGCLVHKNKEDARYQLKQASSNDPISD